jgi:hypothetical protein
MPAEMFDNSVYITAHTIDKITERWGVRKLNVLHVNIIYRVVAHKNLCKLIWKICIYYALNPRGRGHVFSRFVVYWG